MSIRHKLGKHSTHCTIAPVLEVLMTTHFIVYLKLIILPDHFILNALSSNVFWALCFYMRERREIEEKDKEREKERESVHLMVLS